MQSSNLKTNTPLFDTRKTVKDIYRFHNIQYASLVFSQIKLGGVANFKNHSVPSSVIREKKKRSWELWRSRQKADRVIAIEYFHGETCRAQRTRVCFALRFATTHSQGTKGINRGNKRQATPQERCGQRFVTSVAGTTLVLRERELHTVVHANVRTFTSRGSTIHEEPMTY